MTVIVDFDNTLALGNTGNIETLAPNRPLIRRLVDLRSSTNPTIKVVTARGGAEGLSDAEKKRKYQRRIIDWLLKYGVPFDTISFKKEYGNVYIDDQTIREDEYFEAFKTASTGNTVFLSERLAIKRCETSLFEQRWYEMASRYNFKVPKVRFANADTIILDRIHDHVKPSAADFIPVLSAMSALKPVAHCEDFQSYLGNIPRTKGMSDNTKAAVDRLVSLKHAATFFHGDLSTENVLVSGGEPFLIDPNIKHIFGSYLTDAGKAVFSLIAYEAKFQEAEKIAAEFGPEVWYFAVAEGLRVCKYRAGYISHVNNIADYIFQSVTLADAATG